MLFSFIVFTSAKIYATDLIVWMMLGKSTLTTTTK